MSAELLLSSMLHNMIQLKKGVSRPIWAVKPWWCCHMSSMAEFGWRGPLKYHHNGFGNSRKTKMRYDASNCLPCIKHAWSRPGHLCGRDLSHKKDLGP